MRYIKIQKTCNECNYQRENIYPLNEKNGQLSDSEIAEFAELQQNGFSFHEHEAVFTYKVCNNEKEAYGR